MKVESVLVTGGAGFIGSLEDGLRQTIAWHRRG